MRHTSDRTHALRRRALGMALAALIAVSAAIDVVVLIFRPTTESSLATNATDSTAIGSPSEDSAQSSQSTDSSASPSASASESSGSSSSSSSSKYADGTYTGELIQTNRGDVQVRITVSNGTITNVTAITYPTETQQSQTISAQVIPTYESEAEKAQSASIQLVSGATETFTGFTGSLQDAINQSMAGSSTSSSQGQS
ncbi:MAG: FMN-binding protein [Bifidobacterium sp.]|uniref:FMN-binding protein n=1 Tax=Bifidobacterium fermentum TaxID=3059035 RepID=A0AB39UGY7_9BIFI